MKTKGFTFIEILVSVTIVGVLIAIGIASFSSLSKRARDAKRRSDLQKIRYALEQYKRDNGSFPTSDADSCSWNVSNTGGDWIEELIPMYLDKVPVDPLNDGGGPCAGDADYAYAYFSNTWPGCLAGAGKEYILAARLESGDISYTTYGTCTWGNGQNNSPDDLYVIGEQ